ncbi:toxin Fic [Alphaproteobacteria bacterium]|nr:toxin Fic [Alphaproteobacteria bacterium]
MNSEIIIYQSDDDRPRIEVRLEDDTVWLTQAQLVELFQSSKANVSEHIKHIFEEGELSENSVVRKFRTTARDGKTYAMEYYDLNMIISLGYRIKSKIATNFRIWATERLNEYLRKGFTMNDDLLKEAGGGNYWYELLDRIRDIRSSEKALYRQVLDLYATAADYDPRASETVKFFKIVQNKLHYLAHGHTAAEVIAERADANKDFMGLLSFSKTGVSRSDITIAKNYLDKAELKRLGNVVSAYFDIAEFRASSHTPTYMADYIEQLDDLASTLKTPRLKGAGKVSQAQAKQKAEREYKKYQKKVINEPTPVEQAFLVNIKQAQKRLEGK